MATRMDNSPRLVTFVKRTNERFRLLLALPPRVFTRPDFRPERDLSSTRLCTRGVASQKHHRPKTKYPRRRNEACEKYLSSRIRISKSSNFSAASVNFRSSILSQIYDARAVCFIVVFKYLVNYWELYTLDLLESLFQPR